MAKKEKTIEKKESTVYIGAPQPGLPKYTVFTGGILPEYVKEMATRKPAIFGLIVPVSQLPEARKNIKIKGHILNYYAEQLNKKEA